MRLIDEKRLLLAQFPVAETAYHKGWNDGIKAVIENAPAVDAVEVVRCRECKKGYVAEIHGRAVVRCPYLERLMELDGYCVFGERRETDDRCRFNNSGKCTYSEDPIKCAYEQEG